ncbi:MAG: hypothetical protein WAK26_09740 [Terracidiphilus sp.]
MAGRSSGTLRFPCWALDPRHYHRPNNHTYARGKNQLSKVNPRFRGLAGDRYRKVFIPYVVTGFSSYRLAPLGGGILADTNFCPRCAVDTALEI